MSSSSISSRSDDFQRKVDSHISSMVDSYKTLLLKGKVGDVKKAKQSPPATNNTGTKSSAPSIKKNLTLETDNFLKDDKDKGDKKESNDKTEDEDDEFGRDDDEKPLTKEELEQ